MPSGNMNKVAQYLLKTNLEYDLSSYVYHVNNRIYKLVAKTNKQTKPKGTIIIVLSHE